MRSSYGRTGDTDDGIRFISTIVLGLSSKLVFGSTFALMRMAIVRGKRSNSQRVTESVRLSVVVRVLLHRRSQYTDMYASNYEARRSVRGRAK